MPKGMTVVLSGPALAAYDARLCMSGSRRIPMSLRPSESKLQWFRTDVLQALNIARPNQLLTQHITRARDAPTAV